jgi:hypothetical protein
MHLMPMLESLTHARKDFQKKHAQFHVSPRCFFRAGIQYALDRLYSKRNSGIEREKIV